MPLQPSARALLDQNIGKPDAISAIILGLCWPNESALATAANIELKQGDSMESTCDQLNLGWNPRWLLDAGFCAFDANGTEITETASASGRIHWQPEIRTCRVHDKIPDKQDPKSLPYRRRTSGEIALLALWTESATKHGISIQRPTDQDGNTRGALFRDLLMHFLQSSLPEGWQVKHEVPLTHIRGLHMRRDVGDRKSDILVIDSGNRLVAALSSKWSWRSDRGTEAAQMVPLNRYRPDVPYAMATAEFPRIASVARESIEDRIYHLCPTWAGAWSAVNDLPKGSVAKDIWPTLHSLNETGKSVAKSLALSGLDTLVDDLKKSGDIL
ncbi:hypothetical protein ACFU76_14240 [Streptomyces sp. NPDC057539]|uniref:hypothetical protein n=1 Tax=Streptomyces sp. NPDC057539 TaxID=3346159 RepID=UPI00369A5607